jgi:hypothetical protein
MAIGGMIGRQSASEIRVLIEATLVRTNQLCWHNPVLPARNAELSLKQTRRPVSDSQVDSGVPYSAG